MSDKCLDDELHNIFVQGRKHIMVCLREIYEKGRADAIEECADKFADILSDMPNLCGTLCPVKCNWGTEENCKSMCKKWLLDKLKEQKK